MSHHYQTPEGKDPVLWDIAKKRAGFKSHLVTYLVVNAFFWGIWLIRGERHDHEHLFPWPVWPLLGWGIGLAFHFAGVYLFPEANAAEREYEKLINNKRNT